MRRPFIERAIRCGAARIRVLLLGATLLVAACSAGEHRAFALSSVPEVEPDRVADFTGRSVRIRGTVVAAEARAGRALLDVETRGGAPLRVAIAPPLLGPRPAEITVHLQGREVVAEGQIEDLGGRVEMLVGDPDAVRVAPEVAGEDPSSQRHGVASAAGDPDVALPAWPTARARGADPSSAHPGTAPGAPPTVVAGWAPAESRQQPEPLTREPAPEPVPRLARDAGTGGAAACDRARESWRRASEAARVPLTEMQRCLGEGRPPCRREGVAVREALAELAAAAERMTWLCPGEL